MGFQDCKVPLLCYRNAKISPELVIGVVSLLTRQCNSIKLKGNALYVQFKNNAGIDSVSFRQPLGKYQAV